MGVPRGGRSLGRQNVLFRFHVRKNDLCEFIFSWGSFCEEYFPYSDLMNEYFVYLLKCADGSIYVGVTNDYRARLHEHRSGTHPDSYTFSRRPIELLYVATFNDIHEAIAWEKHVKRWSHSKKEALAKGNESALHILAKKRFPSRNKRRIASLRTRNIASLRFSLRCSLREQLLEMTLQHL